MEQSQSEAAYVLFLLQQETVISISRLFLASAWARLEAQVYAFFLLHFCAQADCFHFAIIQLFFLNLYSSRWVLKSIFHFFHRSFARSDHFKKCDPLALIGLVLLNQCLAFRSALLIRLRQEQKLNCLLTYFLPV